MTLTILEGPDLAGKTTLAKRLVALSNEVQDRAWTGPLEYIHFGPPPTRANGAWHQYVHELQRDEQRLFEPAPVYDRFIYGELIYPQVLGRKTEFTWAHVEMLERVLLARDAKLVVCLPPWDVVLDAWIARKDEELLTTKDQLATVYTFYEHLLDRVNLPVHRYDYTDQVNAPVTQVREFLAKDPHQNLGPGIGRFQEGVTLLVGEQVNTKAGYPGWPFVSLTGSSIWLTELLSVHSIDEQQLYWINATTSSGEWTPTEWVSALKPAKVIALGNVAMSWCIDIEWGCPLVQVMHPQAWKRFHHHERYPLLDHLPYKERL